MKKTINYNLLFVSLVSPDSLEDLRLLSINLNIKDNKNKSNKLFIKQSYLLLTWFTYLTKVSNKKKLNNTTNSVNLPKFFIKPKKQTKFTIIKSPMAHKTFSQEQFKFKYYSIIMSYKVILPNNKNILNNFNYSLYITLSLRLYPFFLETNLFFLKKVIIKIPSRDKILLKLL